MTAAAFTQHTQHTLLHGRAVALGLSYHMDYASTDKRMYIAMLAAGRRGAGRRHWMKRSHDRNTNARLRHAQATLLGWQFTRATFGRLWWAAHERRAVSRLGPYPTKHHAVVAALKEMGVEA